MPVKQTTEFVGGARQRLTEEEMLEVARRASFGVPVGFVVGMAKRESAWTVNQIDTDYDADGNPRPAKTYGLCMITRSEALAALSLTAVDTDGLLDPDTNVHVLCTILARYRTALEAVAQEGYTEEDLWCYLAWAHNAGIGQAVKSVRTYGLDWEALKRRPQNEYVTGRLVPYAEEIRSFAWRYTDATTGAPEIGSGSDDTVLRLLFLFVAGWAGWTYFLGGRVPSIGV